VILNWTTASEIDTAGFNIYRSESKAGTYKKINSALIPARGSATQGATYTYTDSNIKLLKTYYYKLEEIETTGIATMHGVVNATTRLFAGFNK
jgi:hypothetical protein